MWGLRGRSAFRVCVPKHGWHGTCRNVCLARTEGTHGCKHCLPEHDRMGGDRVAWLRSHHPKSQRGLSRRSRWVVAPSCAPSCAPSECHRRLGPAAVCGFPFMCVVIRLSCPSLTADPNRKVVAGAALHAQGLPAGQVHLYVAALFQAVCDTTWRFPLHRRFPIGDNQHARVAALAYECHGLHRGGRCVGHGLRQRHEQWRRRAAPRRATHLRGS